MGYALLVCLLEVVLILILSKVEACDMASERFCQESSRPALQCATGGSDPAIYTHNAGNNMHHAYHASGDKIRHVAELAHLPRAKIQNTHL